MYELFQALLSWTDEPVDGETAPLAPVEEVREAPAPDLDRCFEAVEQQLFDPS